MKNKLLLILLLQFCGMADAQIVDSIKITQKQHSLSYKKFIIPAVLIGGGTALLNTQTNLNLQTDIRKMFGTDFNNNIDDYLQFEPILQIYAGKYLGFQPKNDFLHQSANIVVASVIVGVTSSAIKYIVKEERPDFSNHYSFPSGHTATAFSNASLLFYEYKDSNIWYASSGFLFSFATGAIRIANNRHYTSDVLAGAGLGIAVGTMVSYWNPFDTFLFGKKKTHALLYPQIGKEYGIGLLILN